MTRGVVLAGGTGSRLGELTRVTNKHLLPVGPWPMVYYPIKKLVGAGVTDIMLVSGREHVGDFVELLGSGFSLGCRLTYRVQDEPGGIAQALWLAEQFCAGHHCVVVLGDNIFEDALNVESIKMWPNDAVLTLKQVPDPGRYGVAELGRGGIVSIEEKPAKPKSDFAITGVYVYPPNVFDVISGLKPSKRGEFEITDVNKYYLRSSNLRYGIMQGYWTDAGTPESLWLANELVRKTPPRFV